MYIRTGYVENYLIWGESDENGNILWGFGSFFDDYLDELVFLDFCESRYFVRIFMYQRHLC